MRAITIRQPWAGAIFADVEPKLVENRATGYNYRGPLLIHAGQLVADVDAFRMVHELTGQDIVLGHPGNGPEWSMGAVVGVVDLVSVHKSGECQCRCSPWAFQYRSHLRLANPRKLARPVLALGKQGLWTPDEDIVRAVKRQLGVPA